MSLIYHLAKAGVWADAQQSGGAYTGAVEDTADGFLHFSTAGQIIESAARHRTGERDLVLLAVEADGLGDELRWERSRGGAEFPHLYGALPLAAVRWAKPLPLGPDGRHEFPDLD
ncbi:MAG: DUF952 domain-containing protein [Alphaproteobacteria bacterium]|nr:DUF952 domain-containing protein [Alphaproteobacteria bacterium]